MIICSDALEALKSLPSGSCRCCVTSPPYYNLRNYGNTLGQIGLEATVDEYIAKLRDVFYEVKRVLTDDGTLWLNIADCYAGSMKGSMFYPESDSTIGSKEAGRKGTIGAFAGRPLPKYDMPRKNLMGIPWRVAFALQSDGWILRQDIIWDKTNCMPESVKDRCTRSHEYIFLFAKQPRYFYDSAAIAEPVAQSTKKRLSQNIEGQRGSDRLGYKTMHAVGGSLAAFGPPQSRRRSGNKKRKARPVPGAKENGYAGSVPYEYITMLRNKRDVWHMSVSKRRGINHFAVFPEELAETCIKAGSAVRDIVLDPFMGSGTTVNVAHKLGRLAIGIDINPEYCEAVEQNEGLRITK